MAPKFWSFFLRKKPKDSARYNTIISPDSNPEETRLWTIPTPEFEQERVKRHPQPKLQRRGNTNRGKIKREDLINVLGPRNGATASAPDFFEDETIAGKAIVLKMPERSMKTYFIPLPIDLEGMKRRAIELFSLMDEVDVYNRLEFELFAFGIIPLSSSLPLLKDREVVYVNLLPPRPPTPFSLSLAPNRPENALVAEVRRPGTGLPFEVVYTQQVSTVEGGQHLEVGGSVEEPAPSTQKKKGSRFKEHMSMSSRHSRSLSVGEIDGSRGSGTSRQKSPNKVWYKEGEGTPTTQGQNDPFEGMTLTCVSDKVGEVD